MTIRHSDILLFTLLDQVNRKCDLEDFLFSLCFTPSNMPYTIISFLARKPDLSHADFKQYYETSHVPLLKTVVGDDFPLSHTRHYVDPDTASLTSYTDFWVAPVQDEFFQYDVVTVYTFVDRQHWERFLAKCEKKDNKEELSKAKGMILKEGGLRVIGVGDTKCTGRDGGDIGWRFVGSL